jgi:hypothetical protein
LVGDVQEARISISRLLCPNCPRATKRMAIVVVVRSAFCATSS